MIKPALAALALLVHAALAPVAAQGNDIPLYETGPSEDASFIRFVNGTEAALSVKAAGAKSSLALTTEKPASDFMPVRADRELKGEFQQGKTALPTATAVQAGEFATVIVVSEGKAGLKTQTLRESPDDFNALKASLAFYNLDSSCADASLKAAGRNAVIFKNVAAGSVSERRQINPVALGVQLLCGGQDTGEPLTLGTLEAGERYSIFLVPSPKGPRIFQATDTVAF